MTFDGRARRAVQGIHRAVEVMEMSSTKTPQRLTRFDRYRDRKSRNQRIAAVAVGIAVPLALLVGAILLFGSVGGPDVPATPPPGSVAPPVSGRSHTFNAPFTYTVPSDWKFAGEANRYFALETPGASGTDVIVLSNVVASQADCSNKPKRGVGTSSEAITNWLSADPALDATAPHPVKLGSATGSYVDVQLASDWNQTCSNGLNLVTGHPGHPQTWALYGNEQERFYVLDLPSRGTVTIVIDSTDSPSDFQSLIEQAVPVVDTFRFSR
jgi:hypothetical protein